MNRVEPVGSSHVVQLRGCGSVSKLVYKSS